MRLSNLHPKIYHCLLIAALAVATAGCPSASAPVRHDPIAVGPSGPPLSGGLAGEKKTLQPRPAAAPGGVYLDVAVPVFDPGLPQDKHGNLDGEAVAAQDIWPQVRRTEAKRFAVETKTALAKTGAFGRINVTPTANTISDLFVLGRIEKSTVLEVKVAVTLVDAAGAVWGQQSFDHRSSTGFYRDALNAGRSPYAPVFEQIAAYVVEQLQRRSEADKQRAQQIADLRYAAVYSPEVFGEYLAVENKTTSDGRAYQQYTLLGLPAENHPQLQRIKAVQAKEQMFIDNLQQNYAVFQAQTDEAYHSYQKETLPIAKKIEEERKNSQFKKAAGVGLAIAALALAVGAADADSPGRAVAGELASGLATIGAAASFISMAESNAEIARHKELFDEMGGDLDIQLTPQLLEFNNQEVELVGTAGEQYEQWKAHLKQMYALEATPDRQL